MGHWQALDDRRAQHLNGRAPRHVDDESALAGGLLDPGRGRDSLKGTNRTVLARKPLPDPGRQQQQQRDDEPNPTGAA